uniref:Peptide-methionine (R)-S-oxide reductase n=1 Tax=Coccolithus braarudii TaxID=221442 RepID=A0A7S0LST9_9EUKA
MGRRAIFEIPALLPLAVPLAAQAGAKSRSEGYSIQRSEREWNYVLSPEQYFVLRQGGTEVPNTSPLVIEKRAGRFVCSGCGTSLFESSAKFDSGTGWPSFAAPLAGVEVEAKNPLNAALLGAEVRCRSCGGHLGDVFQDGLLFQGTPAALTGKRYCIDGAALVFEPSDGGEAVIGAAPSRQPELPSWLQPPKVGRTA